MNLFIHDPQFPKWPASSGTILKMLGLKPGGHLPPEGMPPRLLDGIKVWVEHRALWPLHARSRPHRVKAECPACGKIVSVGRLLQHSKIHR